MLLLYDTKSLLINSFMINFILLVIFDIFRDRMCEKKKKKISAFREVRMRLSVLPGRLGRRQQKGSFYKRLRSKQNKTKQNWKLKKNIDMSL